MRRNRFLLIGLILVTACTQKDHQPQGPLNTTYRDEMRKLVMEISAYAKEKNDDFLVIPQNGQELVFHDGEDELIIQQEYAAAIDGIAREDLFFGSERDDHQSPNEFTEKVLQQLILGRKYGLPILVTDYCSSIEYVDSSYQQNAEMGFLSFAANDRTLATIPPYPEKPYYENSRDILSLMDASNFLYLINPGNFSSKEEFVSFLSETSYDVLIIDAFVHREILSPEDLEHLKQKKNGGTRLVLSYLSIGEVENYRDYWPSEWEDEPPDWILLENKKWAGNFKVEFWREEWKAVLYGSEDAYLDRVLNVGFDGVYLDLVDAFNYFEDR